MVSLKLSSFKNCVLPPLGILPSLKELEINELSGLVVIGSEFYRNGSGSSSVIIPFASLQTLRFRDMVEWEEWDCKTVTGAFPCLQALYINNCPNLKECLPVNLPSLMDLEISFCEQLTSSVSCGRSLHKLSLINCGKLQFDNRATSLKFLKIGGQRMERSLLEYIGYTLPHTSIVSLEIVDCPSMNIILDCCYSFLRYLVIISSCDLSAEFLPRTLLYGIPKV